MDVFDGVFRSRFVYQPSENRLYRELTQPSRDTILAENAELRKDPPRDLTFGRMVAQIPLNDWEFLCRKYPDLTSPDSKTVEKALHKVLNSPEGLLYKVRR